MKVEIPFGRPDTEYDMRGPDVGYSHNSFPSSITGIPGYNVENVILENIEIVCPGRASKGMAYMPLWRLKDIPENINRYPEYDMFRELPSWQDEYGYIYEDYSSWFDFGHIGFYL